MKIDRLDLLAFGPFTNKVLDLGDEPVGLHLLYGPNEAGKSSTLRAISALLFGVPARSPDNFVHAYKQLRIGGQLQNAAGDKLEFVRRKAIKNDLVDPIDNDALPASALDPFLAGTDRGAFERIWGIDRDELIAGGKDLRALKGLAGESLFASALGINGLGRTLSKLEEDGQRIFATDRRTKTLISVASKNHADALKRKRAAEVSVSAWNKLQKQLSDALSKQEAVRTQLKELRSQYGRVSRILTVLEDIGERQALEARLASCADVLVLPPEYSIEARREAQNTLTQVAGRLSDARARLDAPDGLVARCKALVVDEELLGQELAIEQIQKKAGAYEKACADLPKREAERDMLRAEAERLLADIDPDLDWEGAEKWRLRQSVEAEVTRLGVQHGRLQESSSGYKEQIRELEAELKAAEVQLAGLPAALETTALGRTLREVAAQGNLDQLASERRCDAAGLTAEVKREISRLGQWQGSADEIDTLQLPLRATIDEFSSRFRHLDDEQARLELELQKRRDTIARLGEEIEAQQGQREIPTRAQLARARTERAAGWQLVRESWLGEPPTAEDIAEFSGKEPLQEAFETTIASADRVADGLIDDSELCARLEQQRSQRELLERELAALETERETCAPRRAEIQREWTALWATSGILAPLTPREMLEWLDGFGELRALMGQGRLAGEEAARLEGLVSTYRERLDDCLANLDQRPLKKADRLTDVLALCQGIVERSAAVDSKRERLSEGITDLRTKLDGRRASMVTARAGLVEWEAKWVDALAALGCDAGTSVDQAAERVRGIREYFSKRDDIVDHNVKRIGPMQEDRTRFELDVRELVQSCATDLVETAPRQAAEALAQRLKRAQKTLHERASMRERIDEERDSLPGLERQEQEAQALLSQLCRHAQVEDAAQLAGVEDASGRKEQLQQDLGEIDQRLLKVGEGTPVAELIVETQGRSGDDMRVELKDLEEQAEACEKQRDQWTAEVATLKRERDAVEGNAEAAAADQEALGYVAEVAQHAEDYVRLRLASNLLRRRIERHRAENQDPTVALASELFSQITCGSFSGLTLDYDDNEEPTIVGVRGEDGAHLPVEAFSKGTADQLYLALRLAYLQNRLVGEEPMPIVLDDILVDFDDQRALATLDILAELARRTQVILFTHHEHIRDLARRALGADVLKECTLDCIPSAQATPVEPAAASNG
ncbi:MAG: hypothetical protein ACI8QZ_001934 [Chlamydiales bacterium]|jgi:uncharacterized protein YhaN